MEKNIIAKLSSIQKEKKHLEIGAKKHQEIIEKRKPLAQKKVELKKEESKNMGGR